jgi:sugar/nucleoside kinase (ribokinase family)
VERAHLLDEVRMTAAGTAAGTAVDLSRLGCRVSVQGAVGDDPPGQLLLGLLRSAGVDVSAVVTLPGTATSTSVLPVTPRADRLTWHLRGANAAWSRHQIDRDALRRADAVHLGGPDVLSGFTVTELADVLRDARAGGAVTSLDLLSNLPSLPGAWVQQWMPFTDVVALNTHQAVIVTGADDPAAAADVLRQWGAGWAAVTRGPAGSVIVSDEGVTETPAFPVPVVDTTGCGDAFSAGLLLGRLSGCDVATSATFANAAAALVATGLGSDAGLVDREQVAEFAGVSLTPDGARAGR